jgi:glycine C-acetyltransferase
MQEEIMYTNDVKKHFEDILSDIKEQGLWKNERVIVSPQRSRIDITEQDNVLNMCANNYLGLSNHPDVKAAAQKSYENWGYGLSSVRFICGTQSVHKELENKISGFLGMEDTILYSSCFDANGGLFETILGENDTIFSDELNHASIIDGMRLCKAKKFIYKNNNMDDLEDKLKQKPEACTGSEERRHRASFNLRQWRGGI